MPVLDDQVDSLQYATLATVSRCGMVWFSASEEGRVGSDTAGNPGTVTNDMLLRHKVRCPLVCTFSFLGICSITRCGTPLLATIYIV